MTQTCKALEREIDDVKNNSDGKVVRLENENTQLSLQVCMYACICVYMYVCMCVCVYVCMRVYIM